jgi:MFS family permease
MHFDMSAQNAPTSAPPGSPWYKELNHYHWFVLIVAALGWLFDTMDQQLFNLARRPAIIDLLRIDPTAPGSAGIIAEYAGYATMIFMIGWASGGVIFGILGDRIGRAKTMVMTILCYSVFTGLSVFSVGVWDFSLYRFLTGLGVGGQFAVGVALVAEVMPPRARPFALGWVQALSAVGNMMAAVTGIILGQLEQSGAIGSAWRMMFVVGALPALLAIVVFKKLKEPEAWQKAKDEKRQMGSMSDLFTDPRWRRNALVGMVLAFSGVVGLWGIGFFSFDLLGSVLDKTFRAQGLSPTEVAGKRTLWIGIASLLQNMGGFLGIYAFTHVTAKIGRKPAFAFSFVAAMLATAFTFWNLKDFSDIFWMIPLMGFCQLSLFGGMPSTCRSCSRRICAARERPSATTLAASWQHWVPLHWVC